MTGVRRAKVLFVIDHGSESGGAERFALALATHLPRERFDIWFCFTRTLAEGPREQLQAAGIPFSHLGRRAKWDVHRLRGLKRLMREHRFDLLHTHKFGSNLWGMLIGSAARVPVRIAHEQTWAYEGNPLRAFLDGRVISRLATRFVAVSPADGERMVSYEHVPPQKVVVIPNAYIAHSETSKTDIRAELGLPAGAPIVATAAMLRPQKALEVMLEAHTRVREHVPEAHLVIAGDGERRQFLEQRSRELGLDGHVHFLGRRRDVDSIIAAAEVAALSSDFEGTPLFMFECMANHTPLVATAVGGLPSVIESGFSGILVPPRDPGALAEAVRSLLTDPARRQQMADAAFRALEPFQIDAVAKRFVDLYEELLGEASA